MSIARTVGWAALGLLLMALAVPWFSWGDGQVAYGLPLWLWWHIGWMALASVVFAVFAATDWGLGVEGVSADG